MTPTQTAQVRAQIGRRAFQSAREQLGLALDRYRLLQQIGTPAEIAAAGELLAPAATTVQAAYRLQRLLAAAPAPAPPPTIGRPR